MKNKRVLVMTGTSDVNQDVHDPNREDNTYADVYNLTLNSKERYARKHGYDFLSIRFFGTDSLSKFFVNDIPKLRAYRAFKMLDQYDVVMWIDADSLITNTDRKVEDFGLNDTHSLYASYDWEWKNSFSTGNFILNKTEKSDLLFKTYYEISNHFSEEQSALNTIYRNDVDSLRSTINVLEHEFLGAIPSIDMYRSVGEPWSGRRNISWPWKKGDFLVHATGVRNKHRIAIFEKYFKDYL